MDAMKATPEAVNLAQGKKPRDPRLDFFRGIAMFIILIAHTSANSWALWIPARFGYSDATEIFVFCSGMASALAFASVFDKRGWWLGAARVAHRVWQVYWAHICLFFALCIWVSLIDVIGNHGDFYKSRLNLMNFFERDTPQQLLGLFSLTYVPNYFDILPMYLVILILIPLVMALSRISPIAVFVFCGGLWLATNVEAWFNWYYEADSRLLRFPAEPWNNEGWMEWYYGGNIPPDVETTYNNREWFFNPFAWQLIFFTGFAFMRGWIPAPPVNKTLIWISIAFVVLALPFAYFRLYAGEFYTYFTDASDTAWLNNWLETYKFPYWREGGATLLQIRQDMFWLATKTNFGLFRYLHFLAIAYLAWIAVGEGGKRLISSGLWGKIVKVTMVVGQQSLAIFLFSMLYAQMIGYTLIPKEGHPFHITSTDDGIWRDLHTAIVNIFGILSLIVVAYIVRWFKSQPWRSQPANKSL